MSSPTRAHSSRSLRSTTPADGDRDRAGRLLPPRLRLLPRWPRRTGRERLPRHARRRRRASRGAHGERGMRSAGLHHTGYTVSDLERSVTFYRDVLGCEVIAKQEKEGGYLAAIVGYPGAHVRMARLRVPADGPVIALFEYVSPTGDRPPLEVRNVGTSHLCFVVDDLRRAHA